MSTPTFDERLASMKASRAANNMESGLYLSLIHI